MQTITKEHKWRHLPVGTKGLSKNYPITVVEKPTEGVWAKMHGMTGLSNLDRFHKSWLFFIHDDDPTKIFRYDGTNTRVQFFAAYECWKCHQKFTDELHYLCPDCRL